MQSEEKPKKKFVFMFPGIAEPTVRRIREGSVPREMLNGYYQLLDEGWDVKITDARWKGVFSGLRRKWKRFFTLPSFKMFVDWLPADAIVIKDDFSLLLSICAKLMGKRLIYLDAMFAFPKNPIRNIFIRLNLLLVDRVICFSETQAKSWADKYRVSKAKFSVLSYSIDAEFYRNAVTAQDVKSNKLIAVGRDIGRDFESLAAAVRDKDIFLHLITLPYLLPKSIKHQSNIQVKERVSYSELIDLYMQSAISVVPLTGELTYPSGIRAVMEAVALRKPVIATYTPVLAEYFKDGEDIILVKHKSISDLANSIESLLTSDVIKHRIVENSYIKLCEEFTIEKYVEGLKGVLWEVVDGKLPDECP